VTATVYDMSNNELEDVTIKMLKYDITTNSYRAVEVVKTNIDGIGVLDVELAKEFYKFTLFYGGSTRLITSGSYVYQSSITFQIYTGDDTATQFYVVEGVEGSLTFNNDTNRFYFQFNDDSNTLYQGCLDVYKMTATGKELFNSSCAAGSSGTVSIYVPPINSTTYQAVATVGFNPTHEFWGELMQSFREHMETGAWGMFLIGILTVVFASIGIWSIPLALLLTPLPMLIGTMAGMIEIGLHIPIGILVVALILAYIIADRS